MYVLSAKIDVYTKSNLVFHGKKNKINKYK